MNNNRRYGIFNFTLEFGATAQNKINYFPKLLCKIHFFRCLKERLTHKDIDLLLLLTL